MARFVTGDEITEVVGAIAETFIKQRAIVEAGAKGGLGEGKGSAKKMGKSDVDDAVLFLARFKAGAIASFEATRLGTGNQNKNGLEINGENGSVMFNFEDMNHLHYFDANLPKSEQGWRKIMCTDASHPYAGNWWPAAHIIGYEHGFINQTADILNIIGGKPPVTPMPDFEDAYKTQQVLEAAMVSAEQKRSVPIAEMK